MRAEIASGIEPTIPARLRNSGISHVANEKFYKPKNMTKLSRTLKYKLFALGTPRRRYSGRETESLFLFSIKKKKKKKLYKLPAYKSYPETDFLFNSVPEYFENKKQCFSQYLLYK